jgi:hypothetical protein
LDLGQPYSSCVARNLPKATIIYDHFHVIKLLHDAVVIVRLFFAFFVRVNAPVTQEIKDEKISP